MDSYIGKMRKAGFTFSIILFSLLFLIPLVIVFAQSKPSNLFTIIENEYYRHIIFFTFKEALISSLLSLIIGLPGAWILTHYKFKLKKFVKTVYFIPFVLPSILVVLAFVATYGTNGLLNKILSSDYKILYTFPAVLMAHVFYNFPIVSNIVSDKWNSLNSDIENEARSAGANEFVIFKEITLPRLMPSIISSSILVFLFCFTSFAIILVLGGSPRLTTLEVEIYRQARTSLNIQNASSLSIISLLTAFITMTLYASFSKNTYEESSVSDCNQKLTVFPFLYLAFTIAYLLFPILGIIIKAFSIKSFFSIYFKCILNTFIIGILSASISLILSVFICSIIRNIKGKLIENIFILPVATSSVILGLGYFIISKYWNFIPDIILLVLCHGVLNIPYAIKNILPVYRSFPKEQIETAKVDGIPDKNIFINLELPYLKNTLLTTFTFCFALSCGELNSTIMITSGKFTTIPLQIQRMISAYNFNGACVLGLILILMCALVYICCENLKDH